MENTTQVHHDTNLNLEADLQNLVIDEGEEVRSNGSEILSEEAVEGDEVEFEESVEQGKKKKENREEKRARLKEAKQLRFALGFPEVDDLKLNIDTDQLETDGIELSLENENYLDYSTEAIDSVQDKVEDDDLSTSIESVIKSDDSERESVMVDTIAAKEKFLQLLEMPSLSDISTVSSDSILADKKPSVYSSRDLTSVGVTDKGRFTNPLTGSTLSSTDAGTSASSESSTEISLNLPSSSEDLSLELPRTSEFNIEFMYKKEDQKRRSGSFFEKVRTIPTDEVEKQAIQITRDFINSLILRIVQTADNQELGELFNKRLSKAKLHDHLLDKVVNCLLESERNKFLNSKLIEYYKRTRNTRSFMRLPVSANLKEHQRYMYALSRLNHFLKEAAVTKAKSSYFLSSVQMDLAYAMNITSHLEQNYEKKLMQTIASKSEYLNRVVEREQRLMQDKRNEISDVRLKLITRYHTLGHLADKIKKLDHITEDITMNEFITVQNEVSVLGKKIEERNNDLKKFRLKYHASLHITQHNREKTQALRSRLEINKQALVLKLETVDTLRRTLYKAKIEHENIRKQKSDLTYQGGLLYYPSLMYDFDDTIDKINGKQEYVNKLKDTVTRLTQRIAELEV